MSIQSAEISLLQSNVTESLSFSAPLLFVDIICRLCTEYQLKELSAWLDLFVITVLTKFAYGCHVCSLQCTCMPRTVLADYYICFISFTILRQSRNDSVCEPCLHNPPALIFFSFRPCFQINITKNNFTKLLSAVKTGQRLPVFQIKSLKQVIEYDSLIDWLECLVWPCVNKNTCVRVVNRLLFAVKRNEGDTFFYS